MTIAPTKSLVKNRAILLLLLLGYLVTSSIVIEQQRTIESQRRLIRDLFHDSMALTTLRIKQSALKH